MSEVFLEVDIDEKHLNEALFVADSLLYEKKSLDFNNSVDDSFLPEIIRLCEENDIQLILVRMKTMRFPTEKVEPPNLQGYFEQMEDYLNKNDVIYLDFSQHPAITEKYFVDDLHMNPDGKAAFTPILIDELEKIIN